MNRRKMKNGSLMMLKASLLVMVFSMGVIAPVIAQNKQNRKPRKKLKELLMIADSLRLQLRQSADRGCMLQWGDSLLMAELGKSKMSEKKKQRFMKHYAKIQRRLSLYDRLLYRGDSLLSANYYKIKYDTNYISRPNARWTIKLRGNLSGADLETTAKTDGMETHTKVMADCRGTFSMAVALSGIGTWIGCKSCQAGWQEPGLRVQSQLLQQPLWLRCGLSLVQDIPWSPGSGFQRD